MYNVLRFVLKSTTLHRQHRGERQRALAAAVARPQASWMPESAEELRVGESPWLLATGLWYPSDVSGLSEPER